MKRRDFLFRTTSAVAVALTGCGGSSEAVLSPASAASVAPPVARRSLRRRRRRPGPTAVAWIPSGTGLPTLAIHATTTGASPYFAAVYPLPGAVPNGQSVESPEDPGLRGSVLSRWPDGSASVIVVAGSLALTAGEPRAVSLRRGGATAGSLSPAHVGRDRKECGVRLRRGGNRHAERVRQSRASVVGERTRHLRSLPQSNRRRRPGGDRRHPRIRRRSCTGRGRSGERQGRLCKARRRVDEELCERRRCRKRQPGRDREQCRCPERGTQRLSRLVLLCVDRRRSWRVRDARPFRAAGPSVVLEGRSANED